MTSIGNRRTPLKWKNCILGGDIPNHLVSWLLSAQESGQLRFCKLLSQLGSLDSELELLGAEDTLPTHRSLQGGIRGSSPTSLNWQQQKWSSMSFTPWHRESDIKKVHPLLLSTKKMFPSLGSFVKALLVQTILIYSIQWKMSLFCNTF